MEDQMDQQIEALRQQLADVENYPIKDATTKAAVVALATALSTTLGILEVLADTKSA